MFFSVLALLAGVLSPSVGAPAETGACRWVHGRFNLLNGSSVRRIWIIGTHRIVALRDDDATVPEPVRAYLYQGPYFEKADGLFGDFQVCALEPNIPGHMQQFA
jgi:hypothetical protein